MQGTTGEIKIFASNFAPRNWSLCQGQSLPINNNNAALFNIIGTTFGGNGVTQFQLPDYRGRAPVGMGNRYRQGQLLGTETQALTTNQLPAHSHSVTYEPSNNFNKIGGQNVNSGRGGLTNKVEGNFPGKPNLKIYNTKPFGSLGQAKITLNPDKITTSTAGGSAEFSIMQPYLSLTHIICVNGYFPSRN